MDFKTYYQNKLDTDPEFRRRHNSKSPTRLLERFMNFLEKWKIRIKVRVITILQGK